MGARRSNPEYRLYCIGMTNMLWLRPGALMLYMPLEQVYRPPGPVATPPRAAATAPAREFTYRLNNKGDSTEPCNTPALTDHRGVGRPAYRAYAAPPS